MIINYSDQEVLKNQKSIFLAGPTPREERVKSWRGEACQILENIGFDGVVYVPEYSTMKPRGEYNDQVMWEREALANASVIVIWLARSLPDMPAFTTNGEFGYWIHTGKVLYGRPDTAVKIRYYDWLYDLDMHYEPYHNLSDLLEKAVQLANEVGVNKYTEILPVDKRIIMRKNHSKIEKIYVAHSKQIPYEEELYKPIRQDEELKQYDIILPHENNVYQNHTRDFYRSLDLVIAEASDRATGLGIELGFAFDDNTPIYCIYHKGIVPNNSLHSVTDYFYEYDNSSEMIQTIKNIIQEEKERVYQKNMKR